ncbi:MAG: MBL fold metallo-hydrolase [Sphingobium sp.]|nr:MBL fold metallo-hydrolase [Sphingobium sp.]
MKFRSTFLSAVALVGLAAVSAAAQQLVAASAGASGAQGAGRVIAPNRQGRPDPGKVNSPNGGRPEIRTQADMLRVSGYTAPGAKAYAAMAVDASAGMWPVTLHYRCRNVPGGSSINAPLPEPVEVFDGVYSIGDDANNVWALDTPDGIILIDALSNEADAKRIIVANMRKLKLDPARIRMILITHNHGDHYGGAAYLKSISGAKLAMSREDWEGKITFGPPMPVKAADDFYLTDGQKVEFGGRTLTVVLTPGHTPGTVSLVFPVTEKGVPHVASLFGGQGSPKTVAALRQFRVSLDHFADVTDAMQADVVLSNHTVGDDGLTKVAQLLKRKPGQPNPYVVGREGVVRYSALWSDCLSADIDQAVWNAAHGITPPPANR